VPKDCRHFAGSLSQSLLIHLVNTVAISRIYLRELHHHFTCGVTLLKRILELILPLPSRCSTTLSCSRCKSSNTLTLLGSRSLALRANLYTRAFTLQGVFNACFSRSSRVLKVRSFTKGICFLKLGPTAENRSLEIKMHMWGSRITLHPAVDVLHVTTIFNLTSYKVAAMRSTKRNQCFEVVRTRV